MKLTESRLRSIIREEASKMLTEGYQHDIARELEGASNVVDVEETGMGSIRVRMEGSIVYYLGSKENELSYNLDRGVMDVEVHDRSGTPFDVVQIPADDARQAAREILDHYGTLGSNRKS